MPKRSAESKIVRLKNKIRKLEQSERRRRIISPLQSSSDDEGNEDPELVVNNSNVATPEPAPDITLDAGHEAIMGIPCQIEDEAGTSLQDTATTSADPDLDPELLSALGESTSETPEYGDKVHNNLSKLWAPLLKKGMAKDGKDKMIKDYLIPDNCRLLQAPKLNAEISAAVPDMVRNRDKTLSAAQQQLGSGITAVNRGIDILLKSDDKVQAMKHLSNGCRLLCDSHYSATQNRIRLITPSLDRNFHQMVHDSDRDETYLFGSSLSEKIKTAKVIEKQSLLIKKPVKPQRPAAPQPAARPTSFQGNWTAPPRYPAYRGGRGTYHAGYRKPAPQAARRQYAAPAAQPRAASQEKPRASAPSHH